MALNIPYPQQIPAQQARLDDYGKEVINSWALGATMALKKQEAQLAMERLQESIQQHRETMDMRRQELESQDRYRRDMVDVRRGNKKDQLDQFSTFASGLRGLDVNDEDFESKYWTLVDEAPEGAATPAGKFYGKQIWGKYNSNARNKETALNADWRKAYQDNAGFFNYKGWEALMDPDQWQEEFVLPNGQHAGEQTFDQAKYDENRAKGMSYADAAKNALSDTETLYPDATRTGNWFTRKPMYSTTDKQGKTIEVPMTRKGSDVQTRIDEYNDLQNRKKRLPQPRAIPGLGVFPPRSDYDPQSGPVAASREEAETGQRYQAPDGSIRTRND